jgi:hypothetical protein
MDRIENIVSNKPSIVLGVHLPSVAWKRQFFYSFVRVHFRGNLFIEHLPGNSSGIVHMFTCRYQVTHVSSCDHCIATVTHGNNKKIKN